MSSLDVQDCCINVMKCFDLSGINYIFFLCSLEKLILRGGSMNMICDITNSLEVNPGV